MNIKVISECIGTNIAKYGDINRFASVQVEYFTNERREYEWN